MSNESKILSEVADYYSQKLAQHGDSAKGVDWNGEESQNLRFLQLCTLIDSSKRFSINDIGCGYGALLDFLGQRYRDFSYHGYDISNDMIAAARERYSARKNTFFYTSAKPENAADYSIASGIFNVRLEHTDQDWLNYILETLDTLDQASRKGFAFNCLTSYSDKHKMRDYLYYADPCMIFDHCKKHYSRNVSLLHDYDLYEFTILVRKHYE